MRRSGSRTPKYAVHSAPAYVVGTEVSGNPEEADAARREAPRLQIRRNGRAGDEGDAEAGLDRAPYRLLQPELEPDVEVAEAGALTTQLVLDHLAHPGALLHDDERLAAELVERD